MNLIKNACDAVLTLDKREVRVQVMQDSKNLVIKVIDSGKISSEIVDKLFTPYFTTKQSGKGTGIGLTIAKQIMESHGGKLFVDKEYETTCFVLSIPLKL